MKNWKSEGDISSGLFDNVESAQGVWAQTLDHMLLINQLSTKKACKIIHRDLANAQRLADEKAINAISNKTCNHSMNKHSKNSLSLFQLASLAEKEMV